MTIVTAAAVVSAALGAAVLAERADARVGTDLAWHDLNKMRLAAGLAPVKRFSPRLNRGCRLHNRYMLRTGEFGHLERRSSPYFTVIGARAANASLLARPGLLPSSAWGESIYHRLALLQPRLRHSGFAASSGHSCLQVLSGISRSPRARVRKPRLYSWPPDGSGGHAPYFDGDESPSPAADAPGTHTMGTPVTVSVNGPWRHWEMVQTKVTTAVLTEEIGVPIPVSVADRDSVNAAYLQGGFAVIPRRELAAGKWHTLTASGRISYRGRSWPFRLSTSFQTR